MNPARKILSNEAGVISIEFAVLLPILLFIFFGALEIARLQVTTVMLERALYDIAYQSRISNGKKPLAEITQKIVSAKLSPMLSSDDLTVTAQSARSLPLLNTNPENGSGEDGDIVCIQLKAKLGLLSWLKLEALQAERSFILYYVNEANSYRSL